MLSMQQDSIDCSNLLKLATVGNQSEVLAAQSKIYMFQQGTHREVADL